jgi:hypothetical protein
VCYRSQMADPVREALDRLEAELHQELGAVDAQMEPLRLRRVEILQHIEEARVARAALASAKAGVMRMATKGEVAGWHHRSPTSPYRNMTMKQLVRHALTEHFADGATANQLIELFHHRFGRDDIVRSSLSPQLSRLGADKVLERDGLVWRLKGKPETFFEDRETFREDEPETAEDLC